MPLLSTVMLFAIIVTTTCQLRTGVGHDIVRPLSNVAKISKDAAFLFLSLPSHRDTKPYRYTHICGLCPSESTLMRRCSACKC